jgi:hypothetical protein
VQAAQDALLAKPAEEVLEPPLKMIVVDNGPDGEVHVVSTTEAAAGHLAARLGGESGSVYLPGLTRTDMTVILFGIVGTIVAIVLAAAAAADASATGWPAVAIGVAIAIALVNMSNVVGTLLMESVRYHGGFAKLFRDLALVGTPVAVAINLAILLFA